MPKNKAQLADQKLQELLLPQNLAHFASPSAMATLFTLRYGDEGKWRLAPHLKLLSDTIREACFKREGSPNRIMVLAPPRHGKSEILSHWTPTWYLSLFPERRVMLASYAADFAATWGRKVRSEVSEHWPETGVKLAEDSKASYRWDTVQGGGMVTAGVGGQLTGRGFDLGIIDDPVKDAADATSTTIQANQWDWYRSVFRTRAHPGAVIILMMTRWDSEDLGGRLLEAAKQGEGEPWHVIRLPAIAEDDPSQPDPIGRAPGEPLWPVRYSKEELKQTEKAVGSYWFSAMYQGRPSPRGGNLIKEHWWSYWRPADIELGPVIVNGVTRPCVVRPGKMDAEFQSWDMNHRDSVRAIEEGRLPDGVAGHVWGRYQSNLYLLDRYMARVGLNETIAAVKMLSRRNPDAYTKLVEYTANGPQVIAMLKNSIGGFHPVTPRGSKLVRAMGAMVSSAPTEMDRQGRALSLGASIEAGNVYLPHPGIAPWVTEFRELVGRFPAAGKDDVDAASQAFGYSQGKMWREVDRLHKAGLEDGKPIETLQELHKQHVRDLIRKPIERNKPAENPYRRQRWAR